TGTGTHTGTGTRTATRGPPPPNRDARLAALAALPRQPGLSLAEWLAAAGAGGLEAGDRLGPEGAGPRAGGGLVIHQRARQDQGGLRPQLRRHLARFLQGQRALEVL